MTATTARILTLLLLVACTKRNPEVCCETAEECAAINTTEIVACGIGVCVDHTCVDLGRCDGAEDCSNPETCIDGLCTPPAVPPDAPPVPAFDIAYPKEWRISVAEPIGGFVLFVNAGVTPISMSTLQLRSVADDHPTAFVRITPTSSAAMILPGVAGGNLTPLAEDVLVDTGIVTETRTDVGASYLSIELVDAPEGTYDIAVDVVLGLDGLDVPMGMTVHVLPGPTIFANPEVGTRTPIFRD